ncbi:hypothetical protein SAMN05444392_102371 [Seinonella peptonophila]|uniref:Uncharacterized protein n=1 Tax=Seinonella peptonophila TaxID=112248 RepID=A0A1M4VI04_9BACL|nr:hypothetical protein [Seinonella peptonophila]SHE68527.1 hypothetical protein SAMN05444392_102371 [Seinonella peptonophila]
MTKRKSSRKQRNSLRVVSRQNILWGLFSKETEVNLGDQCQVGTADEIAKAVKSVVEPTRSSEETVLSQDSSASSKTTASSQGQHSFPASPSDMNWRQTIVFTMGLGYVTNQIPAVHELYQDIVSGLVEFFHIKTATVTAAAFIPDYMVSVSSHIHAVISSLI